MAGFPLQITLLSVHMESVFSAAIALARIITQDATEHQNAVPHAV
jgi:hypothetical protein